jgi:hypothetical protein
MESRPPLPALALQYRDGAMKPCTCTLPHQRRRIVLTGGPGAGKTAVLELGDELPPCCPRPVALTSGV